MGKVITIASGKGGTGKTTAAANLGAALAMRCGQDGRMVALADMDLGLRNLDIALGLESSIVYDSADVINGSCTLDEALIKDTRYENLYFIPALQTAAGRIFDEYGVRKMWQQMKNRFDYCIIDAPAGVEGGFTYAAMCADSAVIVTMPEITALRDADRAITVLEDMGIKDIKLIINRVRPDMIERGVMMNVDDCVDMLGIPVIGIVPEDEELISAALNGTLAVSASDSDAGRVFANIAARIDGEKIPVMDFDIHKGFFNKVKRLFKK